MNLVLFADVLVLKKTRNYLTTFRWARSLRETIGSGREVFFGMWGRNGLLDFVDAPTPGKGF